MVVLNVLDEHCLVFIAHLDIHQPMPMMQRLDKGVRIEGNGDWLLLVAIAYGRDPALFAQSGCILRTELLTRLGL